MSMTEYLLPFLLKISSKMYLFSTLNRSKCTYFCLFWCTYNKDNSRNTTAFVIIALPQGYSSSESEGCILDHFFRFRNTSHVKESGEEVHCQGLQSKPGTTRSE